MHRSGNMEGAFSAYKDILRTRPSDSDYYISFAELLMDLQQFDMAAKMAGMAMQMRDMNTGNWLRCARVYEAADALGLVEKCFEDALGSDGDKELLHREYGLFLMGRTTKHLLAIDHLEQGGDSAGMKNAIAFCYRVLRQDDKFKQYVLDAIAQDADFAPAYSQYLDFCLSNCLFDEYHEFYRQHIVEGETSPAMGVLRIGETLISYLEGNFDGLGSLIKDAEFDIPEGLHLSESKTLLIDLVYWLYLKDLLAYRKENLGLYEGEITGDIYVVGDSHILSYAWLNIQGKRAVPHLVKGCKLRHIAWERENMFKDVFKAMVQKLPDAATVVLNFGEIDCREDEGFIPFLLKHREMQYETLIPKTVSKYLYEADKLKKQKNLDVIICGIPAPYGTNLDPASEVVQLRLKIIPLLNEELAKGAKEKGLKFITPYVALENGFGDKEMFIDGFHMKPSVYADLLENI